MIPSRLILAGLVWLASGLPLAAAAQGARNTATPGPAAQEQRPRLEQELRQRLWSIAKRRIELTDDQMQLLEQSVAKFDARRRVINQEERSQRQMLRAELTAGEAANQDRVAAALDRVLQLQRQRLDVIADEQREFAAFMTPVQRARYAALQEGLRRRIEMMRRSRAE